MAGSLYQYDPAEQQIHELYETGEQGPGQYLDAIAGGRYYVTTIGSSQYIRDYQNQFPPQELNTAGTILVWDTNAGAMQVIQDVSWSRVNREASPYAQHAIQTTVDLSTPGNEPVTVDVDYAFTGQRGELVYAVTDSVGNVHYEAMTPDQVLEATANPYNVMSYRRATPTETAIRSVMGALLEGSKSYLQDYIRQNGYIDPEWSGEAISGAAYTLARMSVGTANTVGIYTRPY